MTWHWHDYMCKLSDDSVAGSNDRLRTWTMLDCWNLETIECKQVYSSLLIREAKLLPETSGANIVPLCNASINVTMVYIVLKQTLVPSKSTWLSLQISDLGTKNCSHCPSWPFFLHPSLPAKHAELSMDPWLSLNDFISTNQSDNPTTNDRKQNIGLAKTTRSCSSRNYSRIRPAYNNHYTTIIIYFVCTSSRLMILIASFDLKGKKLSWSAYFAELQVMAPWVSSPRSVRELSPTTPRAPAPAIIIHHCL